MHFLQLTAHTTTSKLFRMTPKWLTSIRGQAPRFFRVLLGLIPIFALFALWWIVTNGTTVEERLVSPMILPNPSEVVGSIGSLIFDRQLPWHILVSLRRIALGYILALVIVLPLGVSMASFGIPRAMMTPLTTASGYIPIATLVPLTMAWFGTGEMQKVFFLTMAFAIYLLPVVIQAVDSVPDVYLRTSYTLGASPLTTVFKVLIPISLPDIWQGMRLAFGVGWTYLVLAEVVAMSDGLGFVIQMSQRRMMPQHIYLVILVIALIAWLVDLLWVRIGYRLFPYKRSGA